MKGKRKFESHLFHLTAVTLGKLFQVFKPQFLHLLNEIKNSFLITIL